MAGKELHPAHYHLFVCASCGENADWEGFEDMVRVTGKAGDKPEVSTVAGCLCGHQQEIEVPE